MKKEVAKQVKTKKLKEDKATLQKMCDEAINLVELYKDVVVAQDKQIERLIGRNLFGRVLTVFFPPKGKASGINDRANEFLSIFKEQQRKTDDTHSS